MTSFRALLPLLAALIATAGCSIYDPAQSLRKMSAAGFPESAVKLHSRAVFAVTATKSRIANFQESVFALTDNEVLAFTDDGPSGSYNRQVRLRYPEITGVAMWRLGLGRQIQIFTEHSLIVISLTTASGQFGDLAAADQAFAIIKSHGVHEVESVGQIIPPAPTYIPIPIFR